MSITFEELHVIMCQSLTERSKAQPMTEEEKAEWAKECDEIVEKMLTPDFIESYFKDQ